MTTFFRKRPPYSARTEPAIGDHQDDFPLIGPASDSDDDHNLPVLEAEVDAENYAESDDDFPIVGPAAEDYFEEDNQLSAESALDSTRSEIPIAAPVTAIASTKPARQFTPSDKLRLPQTPDWVQQQAHGTGSTLDDRSEELTNQIPQQLENAIQVIIHNEMAEAEQRIKQKIFSELKKHLKNQSF